MIFYYLPYCNCAINIYFKILFEKSFCTRFYCIFQIEFLLLLGEMVEITHKQPFIGVWYHDNALPNEQRKEMGQYLDRTFYYYKIFDDDLKFRDYIVEGRLAAKIYLILSFPDDSLLANLELCKKKQQHFEHVYIYSYTQINTQNYFSTINIHSLFDRLWNDINSKMNSLNISQNEQWIQPTPITIDNIKQPLSCADIFTSKQTRSHTFQHIEQESSSLVHFLLFKDLLTSQCYGKNELEEMCSHCRNIYLNKKNDTQIKHVDQFQHEYKKNNAIKYYMRNWFLHRIINRVCDSGDMEEMFKFRLYIRHLHKRLSRFSKRQHESIKQYCTTVYRGQFLSGCVLQKLKDNEDGLIAMNRFLSTTTDRDVALEYAGYLMNDSKRISTLFEFNLEGEIAEPYAFLAALEENKDNELAKSECEVLFSLSTIWKVVSVEIEEQLCKVTLKPYENDDSKRTKPSEEKLSEVLTLIKLGDTLLEDGNDTKAEWCFHKTLHHYHEGDKIDNEFAGLLYYKIGMIQLNKKFYDTALLYFEKAEHLFSRLQNENTVKSTYKYCTQLPLFEIYTNIGFIQHKNARFKRALKYYKDALEIYKQASEDRRSTPAYTRLRHNLRFLHFCRGSYHDDVQTYKNKSCQSVNDNLQDSEVHNEYLKRTISRFHSTGTNEDEGPEHER